MSKLNYTTVGEGPPLVFVHGLAGSTRWWRRNTQILSKHFKIYLLDLPGFGMSGAACPLDQITASLPIWMDYLGLECVKLVGHSMGGYVALHLAATQPERVDRLALIDSVGIPLDVRLHQMVGRVLAGARHGSLTFIPTILRDGMRTGVSTLLRLTMEILDTDGRPLMRQVQAPTLILWGTRDTVLPPKLAAEMHRLIPNSTLHYIPRAGHNAMADKPVLVNRYLRDFFLGEPPHQLPAGESASPSRLPAGDDSPHPQRVW